MPVITDPQTRLQLQQIGCLVDNKINGPAFSKALAARLETSHIASTAADIPAVERTVEDLVVDLINVADEEVIDFARQLMSTTDKGQVQKALTNGYVLCGRRVNQLVTIGNAQRTVSIATRFLSADHDVIQTYVLDHRIKRAESYAANMMALAGMVNKRQPGMAQQTADFLQQLSATWTHALGQGTPQTGGQTP